jgi:hypothetical protein
VLSVSICGACSSICIVSLIVLAMKWFGLWPVWQSLWLVSVWLLWHCFFIKSRYSGTFIVGNLASRVSVTVWFYNRLLLSFQCGNFCMCFLLDSHLCIWQLYYGLYMLWCRVCAWLCLLCSSCLCRSSLSTCVWNLFRLGIFVSMSLQVSVCLLCFSVVVFERHVLFMLACC